MDTLPDELMDCVFDVIKKKDKTYVILKDDDKKSEEKVKEVFSGKDTEVVDLFELFQNRMLGELLGGLSIFDSEPIFNKLGFQEVTEIFYDLTRLNQSRKMLFNYALLGRRGNDGLLQSIGGGRLTKSAIYVPSENEGKAEHFIKEWGVGYTKRTIFVFEEV